MMSQHTLHDSISNVMFMALEAYPDVLLHIFTSKIIAFLNHSQGVNYTQAK